MRPPLLLLLAALFACRDGGRHNPAEPPPTAEFILAAGDSAYWVTSDTAGIRVRGAPIELARIGGRFVELYVVDDDYSFQGADLIGQSVYRRDLRFNDSTRVFSDSLVPAFARSYARAHPDDRRLGPNEEPDPDPELRATATLEFLGTYGTFVSYSLHTDVEREGAPLWHTSRHGVLDLRTGKRATLADIAGSDAAEIERRRDEMFKTVLDSIRVRAAASVPRYRFDPSSFTLTTVGGAPAIAYAIPTAGTGEEEETLSLPAVAFTRPAWWGEVVPTLSEPTGDERLDRWRRTGYSVVARYDTSGDGHLLLRDNARDREWPIAGISAPVRRIYWLDHAPVDPEMRHALVRAFEEAASYGVESHIAARPKKRSLYQLTSRKR
jgi:hypothetical protein